MRIVYVVKVVGKPGHGGRFADVDNAQRAQEVLSRIHKKKVRIVQERRK